ncbi:hypothetical protein [Streptococcus intermedius]|nr:hypothetical protein C1I61_03255 [Streptococcus intermedius]
MKLKGLSSVQYRTKSLV